MRVCTQKYAPLEKNMGDVRMHLSNYSINKDSEAFVQPEDENDCSDAHKRTVSHFLSTWVHVSKDQIDCSDGYMGTWVHVSEDQTDCSDVHTSRRGVNRRRGDIAAIEGYLTFTLL